MIQDDKTIFFPKLRIFGCQNSENRFLGPKNGKKTEIVLKGSECVAMDRKHVIVLLHENFGPFTTILGDL